MSRKRFCRFAGPFIHRRPRWGACAALTWLARPARSAAAARERAAAAFSRRVTDPREHNAVRDGRLSPTSAVCPVRVVSLSRWSKSSVRVVVVQVVSPCSQSESSVRVVSPSRQSGPSVRVRVGASVGGRRAALEARAPGGAGRGCGWSFRSLSLAPPSLSPCLNQAPSLSSPLARSLARTLVPPLPLTRSRSSPPCLPSSLARRLARSIPFPHSRSLAPSPPVSLPACLPPWPTRPFSTNSFVPSLA